LILADPALAHFLFELDVSLEATACCRRYRGLGVRSASGAASETRIARPLLLQPLECRDSGSEWLYIVSRFGRLVYKIVPHAAEVHVAEAQARAQRGWAGVPDTVRRTVSRPSAQAGCGRPVTVA
jgi:hypothetical protein